MNVIDMIPAGGTTIPVVETGSEPIDLFNRQGIIDRIIQLVNMVSDKCSSCTFALNGAWGTGKTFVLNKLTKQLLEYQDGGKFFVFHYNCWQYDYYDEPLVAIVAAMLDSVDAENHLFSQNIRTKAKEGFAIARPILEKVAKEFVKKKIGIDLTDLISFVKDSGEALDGLAESSLAAHEYDEYYAFKKAIQSAQDGIHSLCANRTVVVVVDELDRCLPNYAVKVMERLHHLFSGIDNSVVILAVDREQLDETVRQIFGKDTKTAKYLKKFIDFEVQLDVRRIEGGFKEKYADYFSLFDENLIETTFSFDEFFSALFADIDVRTQERIIEWVKTVHKMLFQDKKKDYSFLCFELMWVVFTELYDLKNEMPIAYDIREDRQNFYIKNEVAPAFSKYISDEWSYISVSYSRNIGNSKTWYNLSTPVDIPQLLIWYLSNMCSVSSTPYRIPNASNDELVNYTQNISEFKEIDKMLKIIK